MERAPGSGAINLGQALGEQRQGAAAVADRRLLVGAQLGEAAAGGGEARLVEQEQRVVAEVIVAARGLQDAAARATLDGDRHAAVRAAQAQGAGEVRAAVGGCGE